MCEQMEEKPHFFGDGGAQIYPLYTYAHTNCLKWCWWVIKRKKHKAGTVLRDMLVWWEDLKEGEMVMNRIHCNMPSIFKKKENKLVKIKRKYPQYFYVCLCGVYMGRSIFTCLLECA